MWRQLGVDFPQALDEFSIGFTTCSPLAMLICALCTGLLLMGVKESATLNKIMVVINVSCILFIIFLGSSRVNADNWTVDAHNYPIGGGSGNATAVIIDAAPDDCEGSHTGFAPCGLNGIILGAVKVFFSFIGFDAVTTLSEEVPDARSDVPFGVLATLGIATSLYVGASLVVTGMEPWFLLDTSTPLASAFAHVGLNWATTIIAICTVTTLSVTALCCLFGQPRIFYRMAKVCGCIPTMCCSLTTTTTHLIYSPPHHHLISPPPPLTNRMACCFNSCKN